MRLTKLLRYAIAGAGLFFFGFTLVALCYEPAIDVLGVIVQFLLVFVGLLGIDEWHRQFKFKRKWERLEKHLKELNEVEVLARFIKESLLVIQGFAITRDHLSSTQLLESILTGVIDNSLKMTSLLSQLDTPPDVKPSITELGQLSQNAKLDRKYLHYLPDDSVPNPAVILMEHNQHGEIQVPEGSLGYQKEFIRLIKEYGFYEREWTLLGWVKEEKHRVRQELEKMEK